MTNPFPNAVIQAGDVVMLPITGGPQDLPATWFTKDGKVPSDLDTLNPSYAIAMGQRAQVHMLQDCVGEDTIRIWAALVDDPDTDLQAEFVELFPYAEFDISECGSYTANFPDIGNRKVYAYAPPRRIKPPLASEPLGTLDPGSEQFRKLFA